MRTRHVDPQPAYCCLGQASHKRVSTNVLAPLYPKNSPAAGPKVVGAFWDQVARENLSLWSRKTSTLYRICSRWLLFSQYSTRVRGIVRLGQCLEGIFLRWLNRECAS